MILINWKLFWFCTILILASCSYYKTNELKKEVSNLAIEINDLCVTVRENTNKRAKVIQLAYENKDKYDLSIEGMDINEGGVYKWFENKVYYPVKDKFNGKGMITCLVNSNYPIYIDPELEYNPENFNKAIMINKNSPEFLEIKKEIRLWENIFLDVVNTGNIIDYTEYIYWANPRCWLNFFNMYFNFPSVINLDLNQQILGNTEWVRYGSPYGNKEGNPKWAKDVFAALAGEGWIINVSKPVYVNGKFKLVLIANIFPLEINQKLFRKNESMVMFLGSTTSVLGLSQSAKTTLGLKELADFNYLEQIQNNVFIQDEFNLIYKEQDPGIQILGNKILNEEKEFEIVIKGKSYKVVVAKIPEINFFVAGLEDL